MKIEKDGIVWLITSLYSSQQHWNTLLLNAVTSCLKQLDNVQSEFFLAFNYTGGPNIRFALGVETAEAANLTEYIDQFFKGYFKQHPKINPPTACLATSIFMPFPNETIQYGLYNIPVDSYGSFPELNSEISSAMLDAFQESIDEDLLMTFYLYIQIASLVSYLQAFGAYSLPIIRAHFRSTEKQVRYKPNASFEITKADLLEITNAICNHNQTALSWVTRWKEKCANHWQKAPIDNLPDRMFAIDYCAKLQLSFNEEMIDIGFRILTTFINEIVFYPETNLLNPFFFPNPQQPNFLATL